MNAASPGVVALFQPNDFYSSQDEYLTALAEALRVEYEAIVQAGILLQIDAPDLAMGRHTMYRERTLEEFDVLAARHIEVLNHALRNVPADRVRMHVCWGNYEGPHHHDVPMERLLPIVLKAKPQGLLFEAANPRHAHEWTVFKEHEDPGRQGFDPGNSRHHDQLHRASPPCRGANRTLRTHCRTRAGDCRHRLRLWDLCRIRPGRTGHRVSETAISGSGGADRLPASMALKGERAGDQAKRRPRRRFASTTIGRSTWRLSPPAMRSPRSRGAPLMR